MASAFFKQFALDNNLTIDYGYLFGFYRNFYISIKETLGSTKYLHINCKLGQEKEKLKSILAVFNENELPKYCISNFKFEDNYLQFTFELPGDKSKLIIEFLNIFIDEFEKQQLTNQVICPICNKVVSKDQNISTVDISGVLFAVHNECYEKGKDEAKEELAKDEQENKDESYGKGVLGAFLYSLIYVSIIIVTFVLTQLIINNAEQGDSFVQVFQYFPALVALSACPIIYRGYDRFNGKKGTTKYIVILWTVIISTILGTFFGFVISLLTVASGQTVIDLAKLVLQLITGSYQRFRWGFYIYIFAALGLSILSMVFKFSGKDEMEKANENTFEKLE